MLLSAWRCREECCWRDAIGELHLLEWDTGKESDAWLILVRDSLSMWVVRWVGTVAAMTVWKAEWERTLRFKACRMETDWLRFSGPGAPMVRNGDGLNKIQTLYYVTKIFRMEFFMRCFQPADQMMKSSINKELSELGKFLYHWQTDSFKRSVQ